MTEYADIESVVADFRDGKMVIMVDDENRENEGDLMIAAEKVCADDINFMAGYCRGLICLTLTKTRCSQLNLPLMVESPESGNAANFTVTIEAAEGVESGVSAKDRATTIQAAVRRDARPDHLTRPGHVFPLMAKDGGVLTRPGHTEAGCDLAALAELEPAAAIVEVLNSDGTMARRADLDIFARQHGIRIGTIADLIQYRLSREPRVTNNDQQIEARV